MRLRFAPSPTGFLHIGNLRTAICNYLIAKKYNAQFVLRIEDTDLDRSSKESEESIIYDLKWAGIEWNEGPDIGGECGPYRQSERFEIYKEYTDKLLQKGYAYYCYCNQEELDEMRKKGISENKSFVYSGKCKELSEKEIVKFKNEGRKPSVRFSVPEEQTITIDDLVKGRVRFDSDNIGGDFIIVRPDGIPVYNYIVVIDDALMKITHVIRGEDHLSNTPKQMLIARALNLPEPLYAHHGLMLGQDRGKLSKRHGITSVEMYRKEGYLPQALMNYLAMLGWAAESGEEIMPLSDIVEQIDIENLAKTPAVFDFQKLKWMNGNYIRDYPINELTELLIPYIQQTGYNLDGKDTSWLENVAGLLRGNCEVLSDIGNLIGIFMEDVVEPDEDTDKLLREDYSKKIIEASYKLIQFSIDEKNYSDNLVNDIKNETSLKGKKLFLPIRAILTGRIKGPELDKAIPVIGFDKCRMRIEYMFNKYI
ncbi:MAG: glutamate--tRNA ligase [Spirochaetota bacterium]|nr:glutamate--tRNA ligase [Spirochaetota bacterium]